MSLFKNLKKKKINYQPENYFSERENKNQFVIHHYCPHTFNAGDHFVIYSIRKYLKKYIPNALFVPKPIANNRGWGKPIGLRGPNIHNSNKYADAVILGGSDQYNNWSPRIDAREIQELKCPFFLIGLGVSSKELDSEPYLKKDKYLNDILKTNKKAVKSSVRDLKTQQFLVDLGYNDSIVTGCPALYLFDNDIEFDKEKKKVMLTFPYPLLRSKRDNEKYRNISMLIEDLITYITKKGDEVVIVCHDDRDVPAAQELFAKHSIFFSNYTEDYFKLYSQAKLVIGSRLHATILVSGLGIPSININLDLRGVGYSETFSLKDWNINHNEDNILSKIIDRIETVYSNDLSYSRDFLKIRNNYKLVYDEFMKDVANSILGK